MRLGLRNECTVYLKDNAKPHTVRITEDQIHRFGWERLYESRSLGTSLPKQYLGAASRLCEITFHRTTQSFIRVFSSY